MNIKHDREKVIQIGLNLFCGKGYSNVGLDEICKTTGMTKGAFYNAFESKELFLLETIHYFDKKNSLRIECELAPIKNKKAINQLKSFYKKMLDHQPNVNFMGCMINNMMSELGATNLSVGIATSKGFENIINAIEPAVKRAQQEGDLTTAFNARAIATLLHTTFYGALTRSKSLGSKTQAADTMNLLFSNLKIDSNGKSNNIKKRNNN